ncbi:MAG: hypothetical protein ACJ8AD_13320 [Gemmatimonadaceae bacterium]
MTLLSILLLAQLSVPARQVVPVLAFPEPGLDDSAAYQGYRTRFFRDAAGNTVQVYLDAREGRVVHLLADADDESVGFSARDAMGRPVPLHWNGAGALVSRSGRSRTVEHRLMGDGPQLNLGWFLLGSMRVERDFQYDKRHRAPFASPPFSLPEIERLLAALERLDAPARRRQLALLGAPDVAQLRARSRPTVVTRQGDSTWMTRVVQPSLDGRDTLTLEIRADPRRVAAVRSGDSLVLRARFRTGVPFDVRVTTTGTALTPLARTEIFSPEFLRFLASAHAAARGSTTSPAALRARWLERQVRGTELLSSREKLMAGLPNYATYFGRDMLLTALMMRPIWRSEMSEFAIASALRKLGPQGDVSHEEAMGGQAVREGAAEYATLMDARQAAVREGNRPAADSLLARATAVLRDLRRTRENYHMIDDEFQLAVLAGRWLSDPAVPPSRKRAFLLDSADGGGPRVLRLLRELALVSRMTAPYARAPDAQHLVSFAPRDSGRWSSASWRDSGAGYAGGRYAMDVNAIWAPHALEAMDRILAALGDLGIGANSVVWKEPAMVASPLAQYARDRASLRSAIDTWSGAWRHFLVQLGPDEVRTQVSARLAAMPAAERAAWQRVLESTQANRDSLAFLAVSLDGAGRPVGVANSDPATQLFLGDHEGARDVPDSAGVARALRDVRLFVRAYPVGLFIDGVGPVVANDSYAPASVWRAFERDAYHGPRVVWGREVNLFLLGAARRLAGAAADPARASYARELRDAIDRITTAVEASGFRSELWSYELRGDRIVPVRYGTGSDVQLWSVSDLAVQFALDRLGRRR